MKLLDSSTPSGAATTALAILCLAALGAVPVSGAAASEREKEEPLGRPGKPYVVGAGVQDGAAEIRGASRVTPLPDRLLREHLERSEETPDAAMHRQNPSTQPRVDSESGE